MITPADGACLEILRELERPLLDHIVAQCRIVAFQPGDIILQQGAANDHLHFVLSGRVHVLLDIDDRSQPIEIGAGHVFGEMSVIDGLPASAFVVAAEPSRILLLPADIFWSQVITAPGVARALMRALSRRVRDDSAALVLAMQERLRHEALERELRLARDIQMGMLRQPRQWFADRTDFAIHAHMQPAKLVGGDFYDAFLLDADHLVLAIGDVAGKGISAALFMVRALTLLRSAAVNWTSLFDTATDVNRALADDNDASMFLTLFMAVLDLRSGAAEYINYGHLPPLIRKPSGSVECHPIAAGIVFGLIEDARGASGHLVLTPGSTLVMYTDGVTESRSPDGWELDMSGLLAAAATAATHDPESIVCNIVEAVAIHAGATDQHDDITLLAVTFNGNGDLG